jgi:hypothetical protein
LGQPEQVFLTQLIRSVVTGQGAPSPDSGLDWARISFFVMANRFGPIFSWALDGKSISGPYPRRWQQTYEETWIKNTRANQVAVKFFEILESEGLKAVGLRGLNLANFVYPDLALRPMSDLDILIRPEDKERLVKILSALNHSPVKYIRTQLVYQIQGVTIEVHWSFLTTRRYRAEFATAELLEAAETRFLPRGPVKVLAKEQEVIELIAHGFIHHEWHGFPLLMDLAFFIANPDLNWNYLSDWSRKHHLTRMFIFSLSLVNSWLDLGQEDRWRDFGPAMPNLDKAVAAHLRRLFGSNRYSDRWRRAQILLQIAERPGVKLRQVLRLFSTFDIWRPTLHRKSDLSNGKLNQ